MQNSYPLKEDLLYLWEKRDPSREFPCPPVIINGRLKLWEVSGTGDHISEPLFGRGTQVPPLMQTVFSTNRVELGLMSNAYTRSVGRFCLCTLFAMPTYCHIKNYKHATKIQFSGSKKTFRETIPLASADISRARGVGGPASDFRLPASGFRRLGPPGTTGRHARAALWPAHRHLLIFLASLLGLSGY